MSRGADVNARTKTGETPLHLAAARGEEQHIRVLLDHGADIDARDATGHTPLHKAAVPPRLAQLEFLITVGADVNARDGIGQTPLDFLRGLRANPEWCKKCNTLLESLRDPQWQMLREVLGGFTTVKVTDVWQDSVIIRVEGHHGRYSDALREAQERGALIAPSNLVFGRDLPEPGRVVRCGKRPLPILGNAWFWNWDYQMRQDLDLDIERER